MQKHVFLSFYIHVQKKGTTMVAAIKPNFFNPSMMGAITPVEKPIEQPITPVQAVTAGANFFAQQQNSEKLGVGLVQSNLQNLSYTLPNGTKSSCNTRWIG